MNLPRPSRPAIPVREHVDQSPSIGPQVAGLMFFVLVSTVLAVMAVWP